MVINTCPLPPPRKGRAKLQHRTPITLWLIAVSTENTWAEPHPMLPKAWKPSSPQENSRMLSVIPPQSLSPSPAPQGWASVVGGQQETPSPSNTICLQSYIPFLLTC